jgi:hypothetical protein
MDEWVRPAWLSVASGNKAEISFVTGGLWTGLSRRGAVSRIAVMIE